MSQNQQGLPYDYWHDMLADPRFAPSSGALREYLKLTDGLESPTPYHVWSFISLIAALCGSNISLTHGPMGRLPLNLGIILTGVPAIRKSTALSVMQKFAEGLPISYGPTDTAGQRQGLMSAMMPRWQKDSIDGMADSVPAAALEELSNFDSDSILAKLPDPLTRPSSEIYFVAKELGRLIASTSRELLDFLTDAMDGTAIDYQLKSHGTKISNPLINLIGATTPVSLGQMMPRGAGEHGFLSRLIFVHCSSVSKAVPIPKKWTETQLDLRENLQARICDMLGQVHEEVYLTDSAEKTYVDLYGYVPPLSDIRLQAYTARRSVHLLKTAAILAILRGNVPVTVQASDVRLAHAMLVLTEGEMDKSFYGLDTGLYSRFLCAVAELIEGSHDGMTTLDDIQQKAGHLGTRAQLTELLGSLSEQNKLTQSENGRNPRYKLNEVAKQFSLDRLKMAFKAEGIPGPDEYRTHIPARPQIVKGGSG